MGIGDGHITLRFENNLGLSIVQHSDNLMLEVWPVCFLKETPLYLGYTQGGNRMGDGPFNLFADNVVDLCAKLKSMESRDYSDEEIEELFGSL
jgi:hypothetical protein